MKNIYSKLTKLTLSLTILAVLSSCSFLSEKPYQKVRYYTLGNATNFNNLNYIVTFKVFNSVLPEKFRMIYIQNEYQVFIDDYNKWIQPPEFMLQKYLSNKFSSDYQRQTDEHFVVTGSIDNFDIDTDNLQARINLHYKVYGEDSSLKPIYVIQFTKKVHFKELEPQEFAKAFSTLSEELAIDIKESINIYLKERQNENK